MLFAQGSFFISPKIKLLNLWLNKVKTLREDIVVKKEEQKLNIFRIFFQTVPILLAFEIIIEFERYDLYFADFDLSFGFVGSFLVAILVCFVMQLFINRNPMLNNTESGIVA